jgi:dipeptidyl aminopeptidase/acylaminoacyl peptidase
MLTLEILQNWIQGHPLGRKFKALVTHDGIFNNLNQWSSEELFFPIREFKGTLWEKRENYDRWNPANYINNWATPHLIIHSELDYRSVILYLISFYQANLIIRLPVVEGLAPFNVLQSKGIPSKLLVFPDENHVSLKHITLLFTLELNVCEFPSF